MKRLFFTLCLLSLGIIQTNAQIQKGAILIEGSINGDFNSQKRDGDPPQYYGGTYKYGYLQFHPRVGLALNSSWMIGAGVGYSYSADKQLSNSPGSQTYKTTTNSVSFSPYVRYYTKLADKLYLTSSVYLSLSMGKRHESNNDNYNYKSTGYGISLNESLNYFLSDNWSISTTIGNVYYSRDKADYSATDINDSKTNHAGVSFIFNSFSFGIQYYLRNKQH